MNSHTTGPEPNPVLPHRRTVPLCERKLVPAARGFTRCRPLIGKLHLPAVARTDAPRKRDGRNRHAYTLSELLKNAALSGPPTGEKKPR